MIKKMYSIVGVVVLLCLLGLTGCGTDKNTLEGKYVGVGTKIYYEFSKDGTYATNYYEIDDYGKELDDMGVNWYDYGTYNIDGNKLVLFQGNDSDNDFDGLEFGYIYKGNICSKWEGKLPIKLQDSEISSRVADDLVFKVYFMQEGSYRYIGISGSDDINEIFTGTYEVNKNKVECKNEEGLVTTFYDTDDGIYGVEYIKE